MRYAAAGGLTAFAVMFGTSSISAWYYRMFQTGFAYRQVKGYIPEMLDATKVFISAGIQQQQKSADPAILQDHASVYSLIMNLDMRALLLTQRWIEHSCIVLLNVDWTVLYGIIQRACAFFSWTDHLIFLQIPWQDLTQAGPAFVTIIVMPTTNNIAVRIQPSMYHSSHNAICCLDLQENVATSSRWSFLTMYCARECLGPSSVCSATARLTWQHGKGQWVCIRSSLLCMIIHPTRCHHVRFTSRRCGQYSTLTSLDEIMHAHALNS